MGLRDKISEKAGEATESVKQAKDTVAEGAESAKDKATEGVGGAKDRVTVPDPVTDLPKGLKERAVMNWKLTVNGLRNPASRYSAAAEHLSEQPLTTYKRLLLFDPEFAEQLIEETNQQEVEISNPFTDLSYEQFTQKGPQFGTAARSYGQKAAAVSKDVNYNESYRFGRDGMKAGAKYGDYIPVVGDFAPYLGFGLGALLGVANSTDKIDAEDIIDSVGPASEAADEAFDDENADLSERLAKGGAVYADTRFGQDSERVLTDLVDMAYEDFADK